MGHDMLDMSRINTLQQPLIAHLYGRSVWPLIDICVETGVFRVDVCGLLEAHDFGDLRFIVDGNGDQHDADDLYLADAGEGAT